MEKAAMNKVMAAAVVLCLLLLATAPQEAAGAEGFLSYDRLISCKTLGNCEKNHGPEATRPGKPAHEYTRGCSKITKCRG